MTLRSTALAALFVLAACGQQEPEGPTAPAEVTRRVPAPWFICDAINQPRLFVFDRNGSDVNVAEYAKPNGEIMQRNGYSVGDTEGAAGSVSIELFRDDAVDGNVRHTNPGMLENPGSAYTTPFVGARLDDREFECRWMPRTRVMSFTGRRSFVVHEDADGDLIYTAYNFVDAAAAQRIDQSENGRTTSFSVEVRGGAEETTPEGTRYTFETQGFRYVVALNRDGTGTLDVSRDGVALQTEPLISYQEGAAATE